MASFSSILSVCEHIFSNSFFKTYIFLEAATKVCLCEEGQCVVMGTLKNECKASKFETDYEAFAYDFDIFVDRI